MQSKIMIEVIRMKDYVIFSLKYMKTVHHNLVLLIYLLSIYRSNYLHKQNSFILEI